MNKKIVFGILAGAVVIIAISVLFSYRINRELDSLNVYRKIDAVQQSEMEDWQIYKNDLADFTFKYPMEWEIREDYLYETGGGTKAEHRAIVLCDKKNEKNSSGDYSMKDCIQINMPQAPENERTKKIGDNYLNLYSDALEIIKIYEKVADSFQITDESADAEQVLLEFFEYLKNKEYDKAVGLLEIPEKAIQEIPGKAIQECPMDEDGFDGCPNETWEGLETFSPIEERNSKAKVLENYASLKKEATLKPNVLEVKKYSEGKYILTVQFLNSDGSILVEGPCCGNTEEGSTDKFEYKVKKIDGVLKVITAPWHRP